MADLRTIDLRGLGKISSPSSFVPTESQLRARSAFWASYSAENGGEPSGPVTLALAAQFAGTEDIVGWWELPGFPDWFGNYSEFSQRAEYLAHMALAKLELVMNTATDPDVLLKAIRMAMELNKRFPAKQAPDTAGAFLDAAIAKMNREQLREFISTRTARLLPAPEDK